MKLDKEISQYYNKLQMMQKRRIGMVKRIVRTMAALVAVMFLLGALPVQALTSDQIKEEI